MNLRNTPQAYGLISKLFHWITVLMIMLAIPLGISLDRMQGQQAIIVTTMHQSWGLLIFGFVTLRLIWRLLNPQPEVLGDNPAWMNSAARLVHRLVYGLILLQAIAGLVMSQADGDTLMLARIWKIPAIVPESETLHRIWHEAHETIWMLLLALIIGHICATLHHHFGARDGTLKRMWFGR